MHELVIFPGTAYSLPDGLGDDLVLEVHDSKGKYCGNATLQVADIVDESVWTMTLLLHRNVFFIMIELIGFS